MQIGREIFSSRYAECPRFVARLLFGARNASGEHLAASLESILRESTSASFCARTFNTTMRNFTAGMAGEEEGGRGTQKNVEDESLMIS